MQIPKILHQVWIGDLPAPTKWLNTWQEKHPSWRYILWDNKALNGRQWENQKHIDFYSNMKLWAGVADIIRYEILYNYGGVMPGADYECLNPIDELFNDDYELYAINTGYLEGLPVNPQNLGAVSPLFAASKNHPFAKRLIENLQRTNNMFSPVKSTGNKFMKRMIQKYDPKIKIWPAHYFIPEHERRNWKYTGPDKIFARHFWGTTLNCYNKGN